MKDPHSTRAKRDRPAMVKKAPRKVTAMEVGGDDHTDFIMWLLGVSKTTFFRRYFEKAHLVCSHGSADYFRRGLSGASPPVDWSTALMVRLIRQHTLCYGTDLNVVRFDPVKKQRVSYKSEGAATAEEVEWCMSEGWSVRFLRPHEFVECNSAFISTMEEEFNCYCGLNSYWTPSASQGFAPHYDDVDVFLLQLEGEKEWDLYDPPNEVDRLSRHSSEDYQPDQFTIPKHQYTLRPGDVLYMPRGTVHQGHTLEGTHSLHVTFSANQMNAWADLLLRAATYSIETLSANNIAWRMALPRKLTAVMGEAHNPVFREGAGMPLLTAAKATARAALQEVFRERAAELSLLLTDEANIDICVDMYAKDTVEKLQPLTPTYRHLVPSGKELTLRSNVRLASKNCCRLILNVEGEAQVYHSGKNSRVCLAGELGLLRFEADFAPAIATLIARFPEAMQVSSLPFPGFEDAEDIAENQMVLVGSLRDAGILREV